MDGMMRENDWRLTNQGSYLHAKRLSYSHYTGHCNDGEHDHCEFCFEKFHDELQFGYCTLDGYYWICEGCFKDFCGMFDWLL